jgi:hypothetical protein
MNNNCCTNLFTVNKQLQHTQRRGYQDSTECDGSAAALTTVLSLACTGSPAPSANTGISAVLDESFDM